MGKNRNELQEVSMGKNEVTGTLQRIVKYGSINVARISKKKIKDLKKVRKADAILIDVDQVRKCCEIVDLVRQYRNPRISLKPLFVTDELFQAASNLPGIDGALNLSAPTFDVIKKIKRTNREISRCSFGWLEKFTTDQIRSANHFLYFLVRGKSQTSVGYSSDTKSGYFFTMIDRLEAGKAMMEDLSSLNEIAKITSAHKLLKDYMYVCPHCTSPHIHIRESCPKCRSIDISTEDLVHHFSCAHVGPLSAFEKTNEWQKNLECPKCNKILKHIGVDYDKPSEVNKCGSCDHQFQQPYMLARCSECCTETSVSALVKTPIYEYRMISDVKEFCRILNAPQMDLEYETEGRVFQSEEFTDNNLELPYRIIIKDAIKLEEILGAPHVQQLMKDIQDVIQASISRDDRCVLTKNQFMFEQKSKSPKLARQILDHTAFLIENLISANQQITVQIDTQVLRKEEKSQPVSARILRSFSF